MFRTLIIMAVMATPSVAFAQSQNTAEPTSARCLLGGKTFSPGATIRASSAVNVCNPDGTWGTTQQTSSGCFFNDAFYSVGATSSVSGVAGASDLAAGQLAEQPLEFPLVRREDDRPIWAGLDRLEQRFRMVLE